MLLNLSSLSVYQFPFVVAAGAVAEELFFRVGVQVIGTCSFFLCQNYSYISVKNLNVNNVLSFWTLICMSAIF